MRYIYIKHNEVTIIETIRSEQELRRLQNLKGQLINSNDSIEQLILSGEIIVPYGMKFDPGSQQFIDLTDQEKYDEGLITKQEYKDIVKEARKIKYRDISDPIRLEIDYEVYKNGIPRDCTDWIEAVDAIKLELPLPV